MLSDDEQRRLLTVARRCVEARVRRQPAPAVERGGALDVPSGAFVTLHQHGDLRGCLGQIEPSTPLGDTVAHLAAVVCDSDPRFPPVSPKELPRLSLEISVLTPEREVTDINDIEIGRHGLIIQQGMRRGLLLPQVAAEHGWDRLTFVQQTCLKAGLAPDAWQRGARILLFEAQVFGER
jgi:AmmeMemoRadiSam system protein A